jgi:hypothetical protein
MNNDESFKFNICALMFRFFVFLIGVKVQNILNFKKKKAFQDII